MQVQGKLSRQPVVNDDVHDGIEEVTVNVLRHQQIDSQRKPLDFSVDIALVARPISAMTALQIAGQQEWRRKSIGSDGVPSYPIAKWRCNNIRRPASGPSRVSA